MDICVYNMIVSLIKYKEEPYTEQSHSSVSSNQHK